MCESKKTEEQKEQKQGNGCLLVVALLALLGSASPLAVLGDMSQSATFAPSASMPITNIDTQNNTTNNTTVINPPVAPVQSQTQAQQTQQKYTAQPGECVWSGGLLLGEEKYIRIDGQNYFVNRAGERFEIGPPLIELPCR